MCSVHSLFVGDPRMLATFTAKLPGAPEPLLTYLDQAIRAVGGTPATAEQVAWALSRKDWPCVNAHDVQRLGVHDDPGAVRRLCRALAPLLPSYIERAVILGLRLDVDTDRIRREGVRDPQALWQMKVEPPAGSCLNPEQRESHLRVFYCALAMICGVAINPRI